MRERVKPQHTKCEARMLTQSTYAPNFPTPLIEPQKPKNEQSIVRQRRQLPVVGDKRIIQTEEIGVIISLVAVPQRVNSLLEPKSPPPILMDVTKRAFARQSCTTKPPRDMLGMLMWKAATSGTAPRLDRLPPAWNPFIARWIVGGIVLRGYVNDPQEKPTSKTQCSNPFENPVERKRARAPLPDSTDDHTGVDKQKHSFAMSMRRTKKPAKTPNDSVRFT